VKDETKEARIVAIARRCARSCAVHGQGSQTRHASILPRGASCRALKGWFDRICSNATALTGSFERKLAVPNEGMKEIACSLRLRSQFHPM
jgi:hypothetical protein